ncbi:esterase [Massilia sp. KIM]|uniref:alpha/beta hydrolase fold domain-containing protein n=1 Tax=Massilia sp. KIM TaxID=1955422 RepID=UPI00098F6B69|nr:alpha/beta hydrolase [Massilia sp. KIM]OON59950.1 esterase [Massilia sp. KIM]
MPDTAIHTRQGSTSFINIEPDERLREAALREQFARFWAAGSASLRATYDAFISNCPMAEGVAVEAVEDDGVRGWWVRPAASKPGEAILYVHGGGYVLGSAAAYRGFVSQLVARTGLPALVIDYPLAPEAALPAAPEAALAAWRWLRERGFERVALAGDSAGGGLALVTLARIAALPDAGAPLAGVVFSPWTDLASTGASMRDEAVQDPLIGYDYLQDCANKVLVHRSAFDPLASPLYGELRGLPPLLIQVGTDERLLDDARGYAERARRAGSVVDLEVWEGMHHVFQLDVAHLASSRAALDKAARFILAAFGR